MSWRRTALAAGLLTAIAAELVLAGCSAAPSRSASPSTSTGASVSPSPARASADRPPSTMAPWPDAGDFAVDPTKATIPAYNLSLDKRWDDYDYLMRIAGTAQARWVGSWEDDVRVAGLAREVYQRAAREDRIGLIAYQGMRDYPCERAAADPSLEDAYLARTEALVSRLPDSHAEAWIVVEPALLPTLGTCADDPRGQWLVEAIEIVADAGSAVYLDVSGFFDVAGFGTADSGPERAAEILSLIDLSRVAGLAVNVGGHRPTAEQHAFADAVLVELASKGVDVTSLRSGPDPGDSGLGVIVDTSRNGVPLKGAQCNAADAGIGAPPRLTEGEGTLDALVWIKRVGESDGPCNSGLGVGQFDMGKALVLARNGNLDAGL